MNFEEAIRYSLKKLWIIESCTKIDSWCVGILPIDRIFFRHPNAIIDSELEIAPFGSIDPIIAEHIVSLHNKSLGYDDNNKEKRLEALQRLSDLDQELGLI